jgi:hypothetical protein
MKILQNNAQRGKLKKRRRKKRKKRKRRERKRESARRLDGSEASDIPPDPRLQRVPGGYMRM